MILLVGSWGDVAFAGQGAGSRAIVPGMKGSLVAGLAALALSAPVVVLASVPAEAQAPGKYYSSCDRLHRDFRYGVAKSARAAQRQVRQGNHRPASGPKARKVYKRNHSRLDRDNDGTACEA